MTDTKSRQLWCAVILQALDDARGPSWDVPEREVARARAWLTQPNVDFDEVCHLAGLDPEAVRERARAVLASSKPREPKRTKLARLIAFQGEALSVMEWSKRTGISAGTISARLKNGWSVERTLTEPLQPRPGRPGVGNDFPTIEGTGGGRHAQDFSELEFSQ